MGSLSYFVNVSTCCYSKKITDYKNNFINVTNRTVTPQLTQLNLIISFWNKKGGVVYFDKNNKKSRLRVLRTMKCLLPISGRSMRIAFNFLSFLATDLFFSIHLLYFFMSPLKEFNT